MIPFVLILKTPSNVVRSALPLLLVAQLAKLLLLGRTSVQRLNLAVAELLRPAVGSQKLLLLVVVLQNRQLLTEAKYFLELLRQIIQAMLAGAKVAQQAMH